MGLLYFMPLIAMCLCVAVDGIKRPYCARRVETSQGSVIGKHVKINYHLITAFLGIPYAVPPIGERRFAKPEPITKWGKTIQANKKSPTCEQFTKRDFGWIPKGLKTSEDCLYLNIWTPVRCFRNTTEKLPVLVWIYGGAYSQGSASMYIYDGGVMSAHGNVIVANMNYRVGSFGFLNSGTDEAPGNVGLYDQLLAMKWIKENIDKFGGDPNKITLFGESAGAISVGNHLISPLSKGLFQKGIMESGPNILPFFTDDYNVSIDRANNFSKLVGCGNEKENFLNKPKEVLECMKKKNASELAHAEDTITSKSLYYFSFWYGNEFLPESPRTAYKAKHFTPLPILMGTNRDEATILLNYYFPELFPRDKTPRLNLTQAKQLIAGIAILTLQVPPQEIFDFYLKNIKEEDSEDILRAVIYFYEDFVLHCLSLFFVENYGNSRLYWLSQRSGKDPAAEWMGVPHFYEVQYVFGRPILDSRKYTLDDKRFSIDLIHKWTNFARSGNPLPLHGKKSWPLVSPSSNPTVYQLNLNSEGIIPHPRAEACKFWRPHLAL